MFGGLGIALLLLGCAGPTTVVTAPTGPGEKVIEIRATSFNFEPNIIRARQGDRLVLVVENAAGMEHNITIRNPGDEVLLSRDLPKHETARIEVFLPERGNYSFYCDKPMHPGLGMKGRLEVE